mmetsp:Transcript_26054/g.42730  ORF Transcript_26054/g.42730 Transcript_26054/m.42730 type:complete len:101 (-) Transcript_26054:172-474(-)
MGRGSVQPSKTTEGREASCSSHREGSRLQYSMGKSMARTDGHLWTTSLKRTRGAEAIEAEVAEAAEGEAVAVVGKVVGPDLKLKARFMSLPKWSEWLSPS